MWPGNSPTEQTLWKLALVLCTCLLFLSIFNRDLWTPDEPRVAAISIEMNDDGNLALPHLAGAPFVEKPPLYFIVAAGSVRLLGPLVGEVGAVRLTSALWGALTLWVTFLLAKLLARTRASENARAPDGKALELSPQHFALLTILLLASMLGFARNMNWIRVDAALVFWSLAASWAFAEAYLGQRPRMLWLAGAFLAGSFLSKGPVGIIFVGAAWLGLFPLWATRRWQAGTRNFWVGHHLMSLLFFLLFAGAWVVALRIQAGAELFDEWFLENQVGRMRGTADSGHMRPGQPFYYVESVLTQGLPWSPLLILWLGTAIRTWWTQRQLDAGRVFLLVWMGISLLVLSISVTKRDLYIIPLLPVFALMAAECLEGGMARWFRGFLWLWIGLALFLLAILTLLPGLWLLLPVEALAKLGEDPVPWTVWNAISLLGLIGAALLSFRWKEYPFALRTVLVTAILFNCLLGVLVPVLDARKSMETEIQRFGALIEPAERERIAALRFTETMRGLFYVYLRWPIQEVDQERAQQIIRGEDPDYQSVIVNGNRSLPQLLKHPYVLRAEAAPGSPGHLRPLYWVAGPETPAATPDE